MKNSICKTPVLFTIFNRPDVTRQVFTEIKKARPTQLFIAADGPRKDRENDIRLCAETRSITNDIDWECEVHLLFRDENLGCMRGMVSALDWFFEHVEEGIILEDDCVPSPDFFIYCTILLERYRNDIDIFLIGGTNLYRDKPPIETSYFFTHYYPLWGWAGWRRSWKHYDIDMTYFDRDNVNKIIWNLYHNKKISKLYNDIWDLYSIHNLDSWDMQLVYQFMIREGKSIMPQLNLVSNIGIVGTHTDKKYSLQFLPTYTFPRNNIIHPQNSNVDILLDIKMILHIIDLNKLSIWKNTKKQLKRALAQCGIKI